MNRGIGRTRTNSRNDQLTQFSTDRPGTAARSLSLLTTVHLPLYEVGALACERMVERVHGKIDKVAETLPTHLVVRESTAMAK